MRFDFHGLTDCYKNRVIEDNVKEGGAQSELNNLQVFRVDYF